MAITAAGVGSGIDIESILSQLNQLERRPIDLLEEKREALDVELSAYGTIKSSLNEFQDAAEVLANTRDFGAFVASSSDEEVFTATASNGKTAERHEIEVQSLASNHRLATAAYGSEQAAVEKGTLDFTIGDNTFQVVIDDSNATLAGMRSAINAATDNDSVTASIINVDGGSRMILTARESGTDGQINISRQGATPAETAAEFSEITAATDATLVVHGFTVTSSSNNVSGVIDGVTLNLTGTGTAIVDSQRDMSSLRESLDEFVKKYNTMKDTLNDLGDRDLSGDQLPRGLESRLRQLFLSSVDIGTESESIALDLGFTFDRFGTLSIDTDKYESALENGVEDYVAAFTDQDDGIGSRFKDLVDEYTQSGGILDLREDGVDTRRDSINDQIDRLEYRIEKINARLRRQYSNMDLTVSNLQSTSSFLVSRLGNTGTI